MTYAIVAIALAMGAAVDMKRTLASAQATHFLGEIQMPARFQPMRFTSDRIYGVWRDDLDVQYVMALRVGATGDRPSTVDIGG